MHHDAECDDGEKGHDNCRHEDKFDYGDDGVEEKLILVSDHKLGQVRNSMGMPQDIKEQEGGKHKKNDSLRRQRLNQLSQLLDAFMETVTCEQQSRHWCSSNCTGHSGAYCFEMYSVRSVLIEFAISATSTTLCV